jgi:glycogen operon protein
MAEMTEGVPEPPGARAVAGGMHVAVVAPAAERVELCLFDAQGEAEVARHILPARSGDVWHGLVPGVAPGQRYGLRADGPAAGRFDPAKLLLDPWATAIDRPFRLHPAMLAQGADTAGVMPKAVLADPLPPPPLPPPPAAGPRVIYELHVRGFTRLHPEIPEALRGTLAGLAHPAAIAHLRRLGVTHVELMPLAAGIEERHLPPLGLTNYWNYNPVALLAPDPRLAPGGMAELRAATEALRDAGIGTILDVVLNHTGEGDEHGPILSLRGLADALFHRRHGTGYANDAGCGNTLALDRPWPLRLAMDALRHWVAWGGVDGFRLDLGVTLGRRDHGFDPAAPLLAAMRQDPWLRDRIVIAEPWDIGAGGYRLGEFPPGWGEWNDRFRDDVRRFWRGQHLRRRAPGRRQHQLRHGA